MRNFLRKGIAPLFIVLAIAGALMVGVSGYVVVKNMSGFGPNSPNPNLQISQQEQGVRSERLPDQRAPIAPAAEESSANSVSGDFDWSVSIAPSAGLPEGVFVDFVLSSLSAPKGKVDALWDVVIPEEEKQKSHLSFPYGYIGAIAEPLDLIEELRINNNTTDSVFLYGIANEQTSFLTMPPRQGSKATPFMLLPDKFFNEKGAVIRCKNRNVKKLMDYAMHGGIADPEVKSFAQNNLCDFEVRLEIKPRSSITLNPGMYAAAFDLVRGEVVEDIFNGTHKDIIKANIKSLGGEVWLMPQKFEERDDVAQKDTFNIGGFIVADTRDATLLSDILKIRDTNDQLVQVKIGKSTNGVKIQSYRIPTEPFTATQNTFNKDVLGMQVFWYLNNFWEADKVTGVYDAPTIEMLKKFQRETKIVETGEFDAMTLFVTRAFERNFSFYENYGDDQVTISFDSSKPYFRLFSRGYNVVSLNKDYSDSSLIRRVARKNCGQPYCSIYAYFLDDKETYVGGEVALLNNTPERKDCALIAPDGTAVKYFSIDSNHIYSQEVRMGIISIPTMHQLKCGDKLLEIELLPAEQKSRG